MAQLDYQVGNETEESFEAMPAGTYLAVIEESNYAPNKKGTGMILSLKYQIIDGPLKGRIIFENLNLQNQSKQAEAIARKSLNSISMACGYGEGKVVSDSTMLHNIPMYIDVKVKDDPVYGKKNEIKKHEVASNVNVAAPPVEQQPAIPGTVQQPAVDPPAAQPDTNENPPWVK